MMVIEFINGIYEMLKLHIILYSLCFQKRIAHNTSKLFKTMSVYCLKKQSV